MKAGRKLSAATTSDGVVALNGVLDPIGGAAFSNELHRIERRMYDDSHGGITAQHNGRLRCTTHDRNPAKRNQHPRNDPTTTDDEDDEP